MKKTFSELLLQEIRKGKDLFIVLQELEDTGEFKEEEIQEWFDKHNERKGVRK